MKKRLVRLALVTLISATALTAAVAGIASGLEVVKARQVGQCAWGENTPLPCMNTAIQGTQYCRLHSGL